MAASPQWFLGFDSLMELIAFVIASAVAYQALKGYKLSRERTFLYLNISFLLLGVGLLVDALANTLVLLAGLKRGLLFLTSVGYTIDFLAQVIAYGILLVAYIQQTRSIQAEATIALATLPIALIELNAFAELVLIFLVAYVAAQTGINYSVSKTTNSLLVFGAFLSLTVAHVFFLLFTVVPLFFAFAHFAQLFGFLLLLAMLLRVNQAQ